MLTQDSLDHTDDDPISPGGRGPGHWFLDGPRVPGVAHHDVVPDLVINPLMIN